MPGQEKEIRELEEVRQRTLDEIARLKLELRTELDPASAADDDAADAASDIYERGKIIALIQGLETKLRSIYNAIEAAKKGSYGICEMCGEPIPLERLAIVPETTLCVKCASKAERNLRRWQPDTELRRAARRRRAIMVEDEGEDKDDDMNDDNDDMDDLSDEFEEDFEDGED